MKKYVVTWEDEVIVICKTRADAEEYVFSMVEENAYEDFLQSIRYWNGDGWVPDIFFGCVRYDFEHENQRRTRPFENLYAYMLNRNRYGWYIQDVEELD